MKDKVLKADSFVDQRGIIRLPRSLIEGAANLFTGKDVVITIAPKSEFRSLDQNSYYWVAIVNAITDRFNDLGERFTPDIVHEILKYKFLRVFRYSEKTGQVEVEYIRSSSSLKMYEFAFYIEDCIRYAAEDLELPIEPPTRARKDFNFAQYPKDKEKRPTYLKRITRYVEDIFSEDDLVRYFNQNTDWEHDAEIKAIFRARYQAIKAH